MNEDESMASRSPQVSTVESVSNSSNHDARREGRGPNEELHQAHSTDHQDDQGQAQAINQGDEYIDAEVQSATLEDPEASPNSHLSWAQVVSSTSRPSTMHERHRSSNQEEQEAPEGMEETKSNGDQGAAENEVEEYEVLQSAPTRAEAYSVSDDDIDMYDIDNVPYEQGGIRRQSAESMARINQEIQEINNIPHDTGVPTPLRTVGSAPKRDKWRRDSRNLYVCASNDSRRARDRKQDGRRTTLGTTTLPNHDYYREQAYRNRQEKLIKEEEEDSDDDMSDVSPSPKKKKGAKTPRVVRQDETTIQINGRTIHLRKQPRNPATQILATRWTHADRDKMKPETLMSFQTKATGYVLAKHNKLQEPKETNSKSGDILVELHNLQSQLNSLQAHCKQYDMDGVFDLVFPVCVIFGPDVEPYTLNVWRDYPQISIEMVCNSNEYRHRWCYDKHTLDDLSLTFDLLKNNTDDKLWDRCLEDYEEYESYEKGGPLMLILILKRVRNLSEQSAQHLKNRLKHYKIHKTQGEDVDKAVALVKSTHKALESISTSTRNMVPEDFPLTVMKVMMTTTVPEFNDCFKSIIRKARFKADKTGKLPQWPSIEEILNIARNLYQRLHDSEEWDTPPDSRKSVYAATNPQRSVGGNASKPPSPKCWNCGGPHTVPNCEKPLDQPKIDEARKKWSQARNKRRRTSPNSPGSRSPPLTPGQKKTKGGMAYVVNKNREWVIDQKAKKEKEDARRSAGETVQQAFTALSSKQPSSAQGTPLKSNKTSDKLDDIEDAIRQLTS